MDLGLRGKVALVTGGSKVIGEAVARTLAVEGCHLHLVSRSEDDLRALASGYRTNWVCSNVDVVGLIVGTEGELS